MTELWAIGLVILATLTGSIGPIFLKKASSELQLKVSSLFNKNLMIGVFFYGTGTVLFIPALKGGELSILYPFIALAYVWVTILSKFILHEKIGKLKWVGVALIILGVTFIGFGS